MLIQSEVCNWKLLNLNLTNTIIRGGELMKKLKRSPRSVENSVEAYACVCICSCSCDCFCFLGINSANNRSNNTGSTTSNSRTKGTEAGRTA